MAVVSELLENDLIRHYSDTGKYIKQVETGVEYIDAVDAVPCMYTYEETEVDIDSEEEHETM